MTLRELYDLFGVVTPESDPAIGFYPQDWWLDEPFANTPARTGRLGGRHDQVSYPLPGVPGAVASRGFAPGEVPPPDGLPNAVEVAVAILRSCVRTGEPLYPDHYVWCADTDRAGDRVYVGGYRLGHRPGLQIHRHLTLRDRHLTLPWVSA